MTKEYRDLVRMTLDSQKHFTSLLMHDHPDEHVKHGTWLHLVGLIETWDMVVWIYSNHD